MPMLRFNEVETEFHYDVDFSEAEANAIAALNPVPNGPDTTFVLVDTGGIISFSQEGIATIANSNGHKKAIKTTELLQWAMSV